MIEIKKTKIGKKQLALIITSALLVLLIIAYAILNAVLPILTADKPTDDGGAKPDIMSGEALSGTTTLIYPEISAAKMQSITVGSHVDTFTMMRPLDDKGALESYFIFYYMDENGKPVPYLPDIVYEEGDFDYTDLYSTDTSNTLNIKKIDLLCSALGSLSFENRIPLAETVQDRTGQLIRYGLTPSQRETLVLSYVNAEGKTEEHKLYIGDKLITGKGYYVMLDGRDYVYTSALAERFAFALDGFEDFLHSRIIAEGLPADATHAPAHTTEYSQWTSVYHKEKGEAVIAGSEVIVNADYIQPIYKAIADETDALGAGSGYRRAGYKNIAFDLASISAYADFAPLVKLLSSLKVGELDSELLSTVILDMNEATLFDGEKGVYEYKLLSVEEILSKENGENRLVKVEYTYTIDGTAQIDENCHAVIDLFAESAIPAEVISALKSASVGALSIAPFTVKYTEENVKTRRIEYVISDISLVCEINEETDELKYTDTVNENSIVTYTFHYLVDGERVGAETLTTVDLSAYTEGHYKKVKDALVGLSLGNVSASVKDDIYCQPFADFRAYRIKSVEGFAERKLEVSFRFAEEEERDDFQGESIFMNLLGKDSKYYGYPLNDQACDAVLKILGGIASSNATSADGLVGSETVAVGLTHEVMEKYGLYDGYKIYFELPRDKRVIAGTDKYEWHGRICFTLYVGKTQSDGTRFVASDMYDIVVKIDGSTLDYLEFSFAEYWARKHVAVIDYEKIEYVGLDFNMTDVYGSYGLDLQHKTVYVSGSQMFDKEPEDIKTTPHNFLTVRVREMSDRLSNTKFSEFLDKYQREALTLAEVYNLAAGIENGKGLSEGYDTLGAASFKEWLVVLYSTYYLGIVPEDEQTVALSGERLMNISFEISSSGYAYNYDFYRIDDRRVMVSLYQTNTAGDKIGGVSDFYISTFAFKKIVRNAQNLLNGVRIDPDIGY